MTNSAVKKKVLIISLTNQDSDPRILRQIDFLKGSFDVYCCGIFNSSISSDKFYKADLTKNSIFIKIVIGTLKLLRLFSPAEKFFFNVKLKIHEYENSPLFDLIIANDLDTVPVAFNFFRGKKVLADLHEFTQSEFEDKFYFKYIHKDYVIYECKKYFPKLNAVTTVCNSIADEYKKQYSVDPVVITNAAEYENLSPVPVVNKIKIIHHGAAIRSRRIELMIETAKLLDDRFTLDLMLIPNEPDYYSYLKEMISGLDKVRMIAPVDYKNIVSYCNTYDIGMFILPPVNLNYKYALPNKFFEFVMSRLAVITGPSIEMSYYINMYELGISTDSFNPSQIAKEINKLSNEQIQKFKQNSDKSAYELSSETNREIFLKLVNNLTEK
ncbi:MAG TPA: hypothetical protein PK294_03090 [Ignavibacteria bacterium]|nr:hypothetical protein [Ignavibacteria bacterium]HQY51048.1 hypothetical protein [Ignavibacteria bacterium]HRA99402.1 hypothetical protein [Ignavibacteria bacterium]